MLKNDTRHMAQTEPPDLMDGLCFLDCFCNKQLVWNHAIQKHFSKYFVAI